MWRISPALALQAHAASTAERVIFRTVRGNRMACREFGAVGSPVCICVPGLSSNSLSFLDVAERLAAKGYHVIVPDLRGRNLSPATGPDSYGWVNHARDVIAIADAVGAKTFSVIGHSMGAFVTLQVANLAGDRLSRAVLIDSLGLPESGASSALGGAADRFGKVYASADAYVAEAKAKGTIKPFTATWERMYREELEPVAGGVRPRTSADAVKADTSYAIAQAFNPLEFPLLWSKLPARTLVVRAGVALAPVFGNVISGFDLAAIRAQKPTVEIATAPANHYSVVTNPVALSAIARFMP